MPCFFWWVWLPGRLRRVLGSSLRWGRAAGLTAQEPVEVAGTGRRSLCTAATEGSVWGLEASLRCLFPSLALVK